MSRSLFTVACLTIGVVSLAGTAPVFAQHGPPPVAPGQAKKPTTAPDAPTSPSSTTTTPGSSTAGPPAPSSTTSGTSSTNGSGVPAVTGTPVITEVQAATGNRLQTFGTWLDNADVNAPGEAWMSASTTYWRSASLREVDAPAMGISVGVAPRVQFGFSIPYYYVTAQGGATSRGFGASYVTGKIVMSQAHAIHVAISPTLEVLSWSVPNSTIHRVNVVLPVSAQTTVRAVRLYGSSGYFSRGSVFGSGAVEWSASPHVSFAATMAHTYSIAGDLVSDQLGITRHRTDVSGGAYVRVAPTMVVFANMGRTLAPTNNTSGRFSLVGGMSLNIAGPATRAPRGP